MNAASEPVKLTTLGDGKARLSLMDRLAADLSSLGWDSNEVYGVQVAMEEAVSNAYRHGNQEGELGEVQIAWQMSDKEFAIEVTDHGGGFDPASVPDPTAIENLERECGRGLLLMRSYMNEVIFRDDGRTVVMRKQRDGSDA